MEFKEWIKEQREKQVMTLAEFAEKLGVTVATVSNYESGKTTPTPKTIRSMAEILGVEPYDIVSKINFKAQK